MESESGVTGGISDELHFSNIQGDQSEDESGVTRSFIDEVHSSDIQGDQMEVERSVSRSIIDEMLFFGYRRRSNGKLEWCYSKYH